MKLTMPSDAWQLAFAIVGAVAVGVTAFMRLTMMAPARTSRTGLRGSLVTVPVWSRQDPAVTLAFLIANGFAGRIG